MDVDLMLATDGSVATRPGSICSIRLVRNPLIRSQAVYKHFPHTLHGILSGNSWTLKRGFVTELQRRSRELGEMTSSNAV